MSIFMSIQTEVRLLLFFNNIMMMLIESIIFSPISKISEMIDLIMICTTTK